MRALFYHLSSPLPRLNCGAMNLASCFDLLLMEGQGTDRTEDRWRLSFCSSSSMADQERRTEGEPAPAFFPFFPRCNSSTESLRTLPATIVPHPHESLQWIELEALLSFDHIWMSQAHFIRPPKHRLPKKQGAARRRFFLSSSIVLLSLLDEREKNGAWHVGQHGLVLGPQGLRRGGAMCQQVTGAVR